ncbi:hypothetical protein D3073_08235 [Enterococcus faecalis]|nr:hypothetical protein [Enterococcus faecalis]
MSKAHRTFTSPQVYGEPYGSIIISASSHRFLLTIKIILEFSSLYLNNNMRSLKYYPRCIVFINCK